MNLYLLSQNDNTGYDTYDCVVVAARSPREASLIHPSGAGWIDGAWRDRRNNGEIYEYTGSTWANNPANVRIERIGTALTSVRKPGIVLASFHAG